MKFWIAMIGSMALLCTGCEKVRNAFKEAAEKKAEASAVSGSAEVRHIVGASEFDSFVKQEDRVAVIDFHADWCGPCKILGPVLEKVAGEFGSQVAVGKIDVDKNRDLAAKWGISSIPDVRIFRNGKQVDAFVGNLPESQVRQRLQRQVSKLPPPKKENDAATATEADNDKKKPITPMKKDWVPPGVERQ